jgi:FkbM family methyltransferase
MNKFKKVVIGVLDRILSEQIKNSILHASFHLAPEEFEKFAHDYSFAPHMRFGLAEMAKRRFMPTTIIDVGAFKGNWSRMVKQIWPASRLVMVEPNLSNQPQLVAVAKTLGAELYCDLLGSENGSPVAFNVMGSGSSIFGERSAVPRTIEMRQLRTLDSLLLNISSPGLLKIDAQGYELEILKGASGILAKVEAVLLEIAVIEINEGAPLLHEVVGFMKALGFITYDILEIHRRPLDRALNQVDIMFIREQSQLFADKRHFA